MRRLFIGMALVLLVTMPAFAQRGLPRHNLQVKDEMGRIVTDITSITICASGTTSADTIYQDQSHSVAITNPITTTSDNTTLTQSLGSCYWYGPDAYAVTLVSTTYGTMHLKNLNSSVGSVIFPTYWAAAQSQTTTDAQSLTLGTDSDWVLQGGATANRLTMTPASDGATMYLGSTSAQADIYFWEAAATYMWWDESAGTLKYVGTEALFDDDSQLQFGTGADFLFDYDGAADDLDITGDDKELAFGVDGGGFDMYWHTETASSYVFFDEDNSVVDFANVNLALGDGTKLLFGDTLGTGDFSISDESDVLTIAQIVADTGTIAVGADGAGIDTKFFGEEAGDYMLWDGTGASKLILHGADSSGVLMLVEGINTTGNTDTIQVTHSGTGDALQITANEADSVGLNVVAAASQTTSLAKFDGATGSWLGAANVGMVHLTNDGALADVASSLLYINNTGVPTNDSRGSSLRIVDTGNAAAGTAGYAAYISATDATVEALYVDDGKVKVDETIEVGTSVNGLGTATLAGLLKTVEIWVDDDTLAATESSKTCVSDGNDGGVANVILTLPTASAGLWYTFIDANATAGDDLYIKAGAGDTINGGTAGQYLACKTDAAGQSVTLEAIDDTRWMIVAVSGTWVADDTPD